jgi:ethanolamine utilization protein EutA (predicted chaperonin)
MLRDGRVVDHWPVGHRDRLGRKLEVLERSVLCLSPVLVTPYVGTSLIDGDELVRFVMAELERAGVRPEAIDTGAVICTGEAAKKEHAGTVGERLSSVSGHFVCATAGHHLEAVLGVHGSGQPRAAGIWGRCWDGLWPRRLAAVCRDSGRRLRSDSDVGTSATVIGAGQFSTEASGETIFWSRGTNGRFMVCRFAGSSWTGRSWRRRR